MLRLDECSGAVSVFRSPAGHSNCNRVDRAGRLVTCEHGGRRVSRTEFDGTVSTLGDSYRGRRLNSPNDIVVKSDQSIWFTDPTDDIDSDYEGHQGRREQAGNSAYRTTLAALN
jgi:gluconolactonase